MQRIKHAEKQSFFPSVQDLGFGVTAALANNILAILCSLSWFAVPQGSRFNAAGAFLGICMIVGWICSVVDVFRRHTYRYWARVVLIPFGALLNFLPFFVYSALSHLINSRLGNGPA